MGVFWGHFWGFRQNRSLTITEKIMLKNHDFSTKMVSSHFTEGTAAPKVNFENFHKIDFAPQGFKFEISKISLYFGISLEGMDIFIIWFHQSICRLKLHKVSNDNFRSEVKCPS